jgi:hypothetical protein
MKRWEDKNHIDFPLFSLYDVARLSDSILAREGDFKMNNSTKFLCVLISISIIACSSVTIPINTPSSNSQPIASPEIGTELSSSVLYGTLTGNETYPAIFLHESGESLIIIDEPGTDRIRGVIFSSPNTPTAVIYVNEQGLPDTAIFGEYILLYSNYTDTTVDVTVISPDGTVAENPGLEYNTELLGYMDVSKLPSTSNIAFNTVTEKDLFWYLKVGAIVLGVFACLTAITTSAPIGLVCFGVLLKIATEWLKAEHPDSALIQPLENAGTAFDTGMCFGAGDPDSCKDLAVQGAETYRQQANQTYEKQKRVVEEIKLKTSKTPIEGAISCSDSSLTPEEKANCGQHSYQFENRVTSGDCVIALDDGSTAKVKTGIFVMTFNFIINAVENITQQGTSTILQKTSSNTYSGEWGEGGIQELIFTKSGYAWSAADQTCSFLLTSKMLP